MSFVVSDIKQYYDEQFFEQLNESLNFWRQRFDWRYFFAFFLFLEFS